MCTDRSACPTQDEAALGGCCSRVPVGRLVHAEPLALRTGRLLQVASGQAIRHALDPVLCRSAFRVPRIPDSALTPTLSTVRGTRSPSWRSPPLGPPRSGCPRGRARFPSRADPKTPRTILVENPTASRSADRAVNVMPPSVWATTEFLRFAAAVVALLFAALLVRDHRRNATALTSVAPGPGGGVRLVADRVGDLAHQCAARLQELQRVPERFRVAAGEKQLADPARAHHGVAEIACQVGYRSLATFNRAFKEVTGRTPTEYRTARRQRVRGRPVGRRRTGISHFRSREAFPRNREDSRRPSAHLREQELGS